MEEAKLIQEAILQLIDHPSMKILAIAANIAIVATAFFVWHQLRHSVMVRETRKVRAHERIAQWNDPHFVQRREGVFRYLADEGRTGKAKVRRFKRENSFRAVVVQMMNFFEALALGIKDRVIDEDTAKNFFRGIVTGFHAASLPILDNYRKEEGDEYFEEFTWLALRWASHQAHRS